MKKEDRSKYQQLAQALQAQGKSLRQIASELHIHRSTVKSLLDGDSQEAGKPEESEQAEQVSKLDPYKKTIHHLLKEKGMTIQVIYQRIRSEGYDGGRTILGEYVRQVRGPQKEKKAYIRYEPLPGREGQMDWSPYTVKFHHGPCKVHIFSMILSYSRFQYVEAFLDEKQDTLFQGHIEAFRYFEGIPSVILYDGQSPVVLCRIGNRALLHPRFESFAAHYGFDADVGPPGYPQRRGRVERPFGYIETNFLPGRTFHDLEDFRSQLAGWLEGEQEGTGNRRVHATTGRVPRDMWPEEKDLLIQLPQTDFLPTRIEERTVKDDLTIPLLGSHYSVPLGYQGKKVTAVITPKAVDIYSMKGEFITSHEMSGGKSRLIIKDEHYDELRKKRKSQPATAIEQSFLATFPQHAEFLDRLKKHVNSIAPIHLKHLQALLNDFTVEQVALGLEEALAHGVCTSAYVQQILERRFPSQVSVTRFKENLEKPKGLDIGHLDVGNPESFDDIFSPFSQPDSEEEAS